MSQPLSVLSICCGMGMLDRAFLDEGFEVAAGCEIDPDQRFLYAQLCGGEPLVHDLADLPAAVAGQAFDLIIGGPPCQSLTKLRAMRAPKFPDLTPLVSALLEAVPHRAFLFENVSGLNLPNCRHHRMNAMHYGQPHQSRDRVFTASQNLSPPGHLYTGSVDDLMAYPVVAGRIYGPKRAAILQGYPKAAYLAGACLVVQKGLSNAVHYGVGRAWARSARESLLTRRS